MTYDMHSTTGHPYRATAFTEIDELPMVENAIRELRCTEKGDKYTYDGGSEAWCVLPSSSLDGLLMISLYLLKDHIWLL